MRLESTVIQGEDAKIYVIVRISGIGFVKDEDSLFTTPRRNTIPFFLDITTYMSTFFRRLRKLSNTYIRRYRGLLFRRRGIFHGKASGVAFGNTRNIFSHPFNNMGIYRNL